MNKDELRKLKNILDNYFLTKKDKKKSELLSEQIDEIKEAQDAANAESNTSQKPIETNHAHTKEQKLINKIPELTGLQDEKAPLQSILKNNAQKRAEVESLQKPLKDQLEKAKEKISEAIEKGFEKAFEDSETRVTNAQSHTSSNRKSHAVSGISPPIPNRLSNLMAAQNRSGKLNKEERKLDITPNLKAPGA